MTAPIFRSVNQALHFSFLMETLPVSQKSQMEAIYRQGGKRVVFDDYHHSTIHFGGLSPLEVRGQCAMVRGAVVDHLVEQERQAVLARYSFRTEKALAVRAMRDYSLPLLSCQDEWPTIAMAWSIFGTDQQRDGLSVRLIADEYCLSKSAVARDVGEIRRTARTLENRARDKLSDLFRLHGLIGIDDA